MMTDEHALQTLRDVESVRGNARSAVLWGWVPLLAFGVALLLSVPFTLGPSAGLAIGLGLAIVAPADADTWAAIGAGTVLVVAGLIARGLAR